MAPLACGLKELTRVEHFLRDQLRPLVGERARRRLPWP